MESLQDWSAWLSPWTLGILGLLIGSFLNVVIYRKPVIMMREWLADIAGLFREGDIWPHVFGEPQPAEFAAVGQRLDDRLEKLAPLGIATPRSRCGHCDHAIRWYENLPIVSWLALRGKCSACKTPISIRYPLVEAAAGVLFALAGRHFGPVPMTLAWCVAIALLLAMALIDLDTKYLPDDLTLPLLWIGLAVSALGWNVPLATAFWGVVAGYLPLWLLAKSYALVRGREGMGIGDLKLLAALGAWTGWHGILPIILLASVAGLCVNVPLALMRGFNGDKRYPFGPFLAAGGLFVIFVGADDCLEWAGIAFPT